MFEFCLKVACAKTHFQNTNCKKKKKKTAAAGTISLQRTFKLHLMKKAFRNSYRGSPACGPFLREHANLHRKANVT